MTTMSIIPEAPHPVRRQFLVEASAEPPPVPPPQPAKPVAASISYATCVGFFLVATTLAVLTPFKEYYLGSYVTKSFSEVRDVVVGRKLNHVGVVTSGVHYLDTFNRARIPLVDLTTKSSMSRSHAAPLKLSDFLVRANVRRADLLNHLPQELLATSISLMDDLYAPLCGSWSSPPQQLFGHWFPPINHGFCRDYSTRFPRDRFFIAPAAEGLEGVTLGLIAVVNMSEVYLRHFDDARVVRTIMKNVQEGFLGMALPVYTDEVASAVVDKYATGISLAEVLTLLPGSFDGDHVALVDVLGIRTLLEYYLEPQQLTMGVNVNGEPAILAEVTHATSSYFTTDFLINTVGMHLVSTVHLAPFWDCAIRHTTMQKNITVADVNSEAVRLCGHERAAVLPTFIVNLMFLFQKADRDYDKLDNTTTYTLSRHRGSSANDTGLWLVPDKLADSPLLSISGQDWTKRRVDLPSSATYTPSPVTPYGYLFTPDCRQAADDAMRSGGRNAQKYQAFIGDGLGNCVFHDSQETPQQTLCRLFMGSSEIVFQTLDGTQASIPSCSSLVTNDASAEIQMLQQQNLRQIEWFMIDSTPVTRRIRVHDNTSRQIRTFLLIMNLVGAVYFVLEYLRILKSVWIFVHNSFYKASKRPRARSASKTSSSGLANNHRTPVVVRGPTLKQLLYFDPTVGAIQHPGTMALLYLGAVGALSNVFSLVCSAGLAATDSQSSVVIMCQPSIPLTSLTLLLTACSSAYWISLVTLQTRTLAERLDHVANPNWYRNLVLMVITTASLHFASKAGANYLFQNVELRSDPHLYAVAGGFVMSWLIVLLYATINFGAVRIGRLTAAIVPTNWYKDSLSSSSKRSLSRRDRVSQERSILEKWTASEQDDAYCYCATLFIAQQLQAFVRRRELSKARAAATSSASIVERLKQNCTDDTVDIHEFVMVHCVAGAADHLETVVWRTRMGSETVLLTTIGSRRRRMVTEGDDDGNQ